MAEFAKLEAEAAFWLRYEGKLTPAEKGRIAAGDYRSFRRPSAPSFRAGDVLHVRNKLKVRIASDPEPYKGQYRVRIDKVVDDRRAGSPIKTRAWDSEQERWLTEPEGVDEQVLSEYAEQAEAKRADFIRQVIVEG